LCVSVLPLGLRVVADVEYNWYLRDIKKNNHQAIDLTIKFAETNKFGLQGVFFLRNT
jgi:hypothetical protein